MSNNILFEKKWSVFFACVLSVWFKHKVYTHKIKTNNVLSSKNYNTYSASYYSGDTHFLLLYSYQNYETTLIEVVVQ